MKHIERLAFDAALQDLWRSDAGIDPGPIFARQGLKIVPIDERDEDQQDEDFVKAIRQFTDLLIHEAEVVEVRESWEGESFRAISVDEIMAFGDGYFEE